MFLLRCCFSLLYHCGINDSINLLSTGQARDDDKRFKIDVMMRGRFKKIEVVVQKTLSRWLASVSVVLSRNSFIPAAGTLFSDESEMSSS
jgi:hypothetical protein